MGACDHRPRPLNRHSTESALLANIYICTFVAVEFGIPAHHLFVADARILLLLAGLSPDIPIGPPLANESDGSRCSKMKALAPRLMVVLHTLRLVKALRSIRRRLTGALYSSLLLATSSNSSNGGNSLYAGGIRIRRPIGARSIHSKSRRGKTFYYLSPSIPGSCPSTIKLARHSDVSGL